MCVCVCVRAHVCVCMCLRAVLKIQPQDHGSASKESACNAGDLGLIPGSGRSFGEVNGTPLKYSCLKNPMDRGAW